MLTLSFKAFPRDLGDSGYWWIHPSIGELNWYTSTLQAESISALRMSGWPSTRIWTDM